MCGLWIQTSIRRRARPSGWSMCPSRTAAGSGSAGESATSTVRRPGLRARDGDAHGHFPGGRRVPGVRSGVGVPSGDHGGGLGHRDPDPLLGGHIIPEHTQSGRIATNHWQANHWLDSKTNWHERWRGSICVAIEDPAGAVKEIEHWAGHPLHGSGPDQRRTASRVGRPPIRPDLGSRDPPRATRGMPPRPRSLRAYADAGGWVPELQP